METHTDEENNNNNTYKVKYNRYQTNSIFISVRDALILLILSRNDISEIRKPIQCLDKLLSIGDSSDTLSKDITQKPTNGLFSYYFNAKKDVDHLLWNESSLDEIYDAYERIEREIIKEDRVFETSAQYKLRITKSSAGYGMMAAATVATMLQPAGMLAIATASTLRMAVTSTVLALAARGYSGASNSQESEIGNVDLRMYHDQLLQLIKLLPMNNELNVTFDLHHPLVSYIQLVAYLMKILISQTKSDTDVMKLRFEEMVDIMDRLFTNESFVDLSEESKKMLVKLLKAHVSLYFIYQYISKLQIVEVIDYRGHSTSLLEDMIRRKNLSQGKDMIYSFDQQAVSVFQLNKDDGNNILIIEYQDSLGQQSLPTRKYLYDPKLIVILIDLANYSDPNIKISLQQANDLGIPVIVFLSVTNLIKSLNQQDLIKASMEFTISLNSNKQDKVIDHEKDVYLTFLESEEIPFNLQSKYPSVLSLSSTMKIVFSRMKQMEGKT